MEGSSYMVSSNVFSNMVRRPRAPVLRSMAFKAIAFKASSRNSSSQFSISNIFSYCLVRAFFGLVKIVISASSSSSSNVATTGKRPTNSGINPKRIKSSDSRSLNKSPVDFRLSLPRTSAPNPIPLFSERLRITCSSPAKAPPQINRILDVSTCKNSCCGCLRPPCGGTDAIVPSISFSRACCTPSPDTSRVMEGLSDFREILSISSIYTIPVCAFSTSYSHFCNNF